VRSDTPRGRRGAGFLCGLLLLGVAIAARAAEPTEADSATREIFRKFAGGVVQVRMLHADSGSKASIGSGFVVGRGDHVATNYHVVAEIVHQPDRYRIELVLRDGQVTPAKLADVDIVHDLAIVRAESALPPPLELSDEELDKGTRLYALGNPYDLGASIVEGTYNGLLEESIYERVHFTGSINPGMSGGPTLTRSGRVMGVNVSTAGNQVSFLVPVRFLRSLVERTESTEVGAPSPDFLDLARRQLLDNQKAYVERLLSAPLETVTLGAYRLPGRMALFLRCWGRTDDKKEQPYTAVHYGCSTEDDLYISGQQSAGSISLSHSLLTSRGLGAFRFYSLFQTHFASLTPLLGGAEEDVTRFSCLTRFVENEGITLKAAFCTRAYRKLPGLYDAFLKAASVDESQTGVATSLTLTGVSFENAERFARRFLETIGRKP